MKEKVGCGGGIGTRDLWVMCPPELRPHGVLPLAQILKCRFEWESLFPPERIRAAPDLHRGAHPVGVAVNALPIRFRRRAFFFVVFICSLVAFLEVLSFNEFQCCRMN